MDFKKIMVLFGGLLLVGQMGTAHCMVAASGVTQQQIEGLLSGSLDDAKVFIHSLSKDELTELAPALAFQIFLLKQNNGFDSNISSLEYSKIGKWGMATSLFAGYVAILMSALMQQYQWAALYAQSEIAQNAQQYGVAENFANKCKQVLALVSNEAHKKSRKYCLIGAGCLVVAGVIFWLEESRKKAQMLVVVNRIGELLDLLSAELQTRG